MDVISKLAEIDPAFLAVAQLLYPDIDAREIHAISKMSDASENHVDGGANRKRSAARAALGAGLGIGTLAEADGAYHATTEAARAVRAARIAGKAIPRLKVARAGLQATNMGIGLAGAAALLKPRHTSASAVAKGLRLRPVQPQLGEETLRRIHDGTARSISTGRKTVAVVAAGSAGAAGYRAGGKRRLAKAQDDLVWIGEISKVDKDKRQVFGWCSLSTVDGQPVIDLQGDYAPIEEIEKAAYRYVLDSRKGGDMHRRVRKGSLTSDDEPLHTADLVESFVVTKEKLAKMGLPDTALPEGWWVGFKVNDETQWQLVKDGKRTGFSIHGKGTRKEIA